MREYRNTREKGMDRRRPAGGGRTPRPASAQESSAVSLPPGTAAAMLRPEREDSLRRRHPWLFSGAIAAVRGEPLPGATVEVLSATGEWCARGAYSPRSQISVRIWTFEQSEAIGPDFFRARLARAIETRRAFLASDAASCCRLVFGESDGLPGLVVDAYGPWLVCQFLSAGAERWREEIVAALRVLVPCAGIYERSDVDAREKEGLEPRCGPLAGDEPPDLVEVREGQYRFMVNLKTGHKTGFYLDQRFNFSRVAAHLRGAEALNCFAYTGGFTVAALKGGANVVTSVDTSADALAMLRRNVELNGIDPVAAPVEDGDVFSVLRRYRDAGRSFDAVILDPPKFADSRERVEGACRGYKDINLLAIKLLRPGGVLATFSCSSLVGPDLFERTVAYAALDAGRHVQILERLHQAPDHPVALSFPEAYYLKGLICRA